MKNYRLPSRPLVTCLAVSGLFSLSASPSVWAQSASEVEKLLQIQSLTGSPTSPGPTSPGPTSPGPISPGAAPFPSPRFPAPPTYRPPAYGNPGYSANNGNTNLGVQAPFGHSIPAQSNQVLPSRESSALTTMLNASVPQTTPSPSRVTMQGQRQPSQGWIQPTESLATQPQQQSDNPLRSGNGRWSSPSTYIQPSPADHRTVNYESDVAPAAHNPAPATVPANAPRPLSQNHRDDATALPGYQNPTRPTPMRQPLSQAIPSPNLKDETLTQQGMIGQGPISRATISEEELAHLRSQVQQASSDGNADAGSELLLTGPAEPVPDVNARQPLELIGQPVSESEADALSLNDLDELVDQLQSSRDHANFVVSSTEQDQVPSFQPYQEPSESTSPMVRSEVGTMPVAWLERSLFDLEGLRQYIRTNHLASGPSIDLELAQAQHELIHGDYDRAAQALAAIDRQKVQDFQQWLWVWQQTQLAVATNQTPLIEASLQELQSFGSNVATLPFQTYCQANLYRMGKQKDLTRSVPLLEQCLKEIATARQQAPNSGFQSLWSLLEVNVHLDLGADILNGPFVRSTETANRWFAAAPVAGGALMNPHTEQLREAYCLLRKMEIKANSQNAEDIAVDWAFLQSRTSQYKGQLKGLDAQWIDQRMAELAYDYALYSFQHEDFSTANTQLALSMQWFQLQLQKAADPWTQYSMARCYWLSGAIEDVQGRSQRALTQYEQFLKQVPEHPSTRILADAANQGERLGTVAVAHWKLGQPQQAVQLAEASVNQIALAVDQGLASPERSARLEQNLATMQFHIANPDLVAAQAQATSSPRQSANIQMASHQTPSGAQATSRPVPPQRNGSPSAQPRPSGNSAGSSTTTPKEHGFKTFWKNLFSGPSSTGSTTSGQPNQNVGQRPQANTSAQRPLPGTNNGQFKPVASPQSRIPIVSSRNQ